MSRDDVIEIEGVVLEVLSGGKYSVELVQGHKIVAQASGKMRIHSIKILAGDSVKVEVSPYDLDRGRIIYRNK